MIRLQLLGSQQLEREGRGPLHAVVAQPKRFALLAYLALATDASVRRETMLAVFWPELDQFAARRALRNTVYQLRQGVGAEVFRTRGDDEICVDPALLWCDAVALGAAVQAGQYEEAVALYRGELLRGFHLPRGGERFESWLLEERERALRHALRALELLIVRDQQAGHLVEAARWSARTQEITPSDEAWVRRTMTLWAASGDRAGALRAYDAFVRRLRDEIGGTPAADTARLAARLRAENATVVTPAPDRAPTHVATPLIEAPLTAATPTASPTLDALPKRPLVPHLTDSRREIPSPPPRPTGSARHRAFLYTVAAVAVAGGLLGIVASRRARTRADPHRLVVAVFQNRTGDPQLEALGDMAADWVSRGLFATGLGEVVDPRVLAVRGRGANGQPADPLQLARLTGAGTVVAGYYYRSGDSVLFAASIADANTGRITGQVAPVGGPTTRPAAALDDLRSRVMTALGIVLDPRFAERALTGTQPPPFPAYDSFIRGWDAFGLGEQRQAEKLLRESVRLDTSFAQAAVSLASVASNAGDCGITDSLADRWPPDRSGLNEGDRLTLAIAVAHCHGQPDEVLRLTLTRSHLLPRSSSSLLSSANAALWADRPSETLTILRGVNPAIDLAWMPDSAHYAFFQSLAEADHRLARYGDELAVADRVRPEAALGGTWIRARALVGLGRSRDALDAVDSALKLPADPTMYWGLMAATEGRPRYSATGGWVAAWIAREFFAHGDSASGRIVAARALAWAGRRDSVERATPEVQFLEATMRDLLGDYAGARTVLASLLAGDTSNVDVHGLIAGAAAGAGDTATAGAEDRWLAGLTGARAGWPAALYRARVAARERRPDAAIELLRVVRGDGSWPLWVHCDPAVFPLRSRTDYQTLMAPQG